MIHEERVSRWLEDNIAGLSGPFRFEMIAGGRSNITYRVGDSAGNTVVLRRPPIGHVLATAHDMAREHRIISAVGTTDVPVPRTLGVCNDVEVNDAPFYVMGFVEGVVLDGQAKAAGLTPATRRALSEDLIDVMVRLHDVDVDAVGLGDLAKRDAYVERQIKRWSTQWANSKQRELPEIDEVERLLRAGVPEQRGTVIAHGDYRFGNCLADVANGRIAAVLDWELCTLGDPLADLGYVGIYWTDPGATNRRGTDPSGIPGFPPFAHLVDRYATRTGRDVSRIGYYMAFASFRLAVISEGVYARYIAGAMGSQDVDVSTFKTGTETLAEAALAALAGDL